MIDLIAGRIPGGYPGVGIHFWVLWPICAFIAFAVAVLAATLQSLIGPVGTLAAVVIVVFIGNPSTGGVNGVGFPPPFWQAIGVVLPPRNGLYLIRNTLYFGGNDITVPLIVLLRPGRGRAGQRRAGRAAVRRSRRRTGAERGFATAKDPATSDISRGWCRLMGLAPLMLLTTTLLIVRNQRTLAAWNARQEENQRRAAKGLPPKTRRRRRGTLASLATGPP